MRAKFVAPVGAVALLLVAAACDDLGTKTVTLDDVPGIDLAVGDVNGDGRADLVSAGWYQGTDQSRIQRSDYAVSLSAGDGRFTVQPVDEDHDFDTETTRVHLADLDGDGDLDLLRAYEHVVDGIFDEDLAISRGDGTGHFGLPEITDNPETVDVVHDIATGDLNGDGALDVVLAGQYPYTSAYVYLGDGSGGVLPPTTVTVPSTSTTALGELTDIAVEDVDHDGDGDVVGSARACAQPSQDPFDECGETYDPARAVVVLRGDGSGGLSPEVALTRFGAISGEGLAVGDLDEDGFADLVMAGSGPLALAHGRPGGAFVDAGSAPTGIQHCPVIRGLAATDVDQDGHLDVVAIGSCAEGAVLFGDGHGTFGPPHRLTFGINPNIAHTNALVAGDVSGDGRDDVVVSASGCPCDTSHPQIGVMVNAWHD
jgi:VCBS repeat protein